MVIVGKDCFIKLINLNGNLNGAQLPAVGPPSCLWILQAYLTSSFVPFGHSGRVTHIDDHLLPCDDNIGIAHSSRLRLASLLGCEILFLRPEIEKRLRAV